MIAAADAANRVCAVTLRPRTLECFASRLTTDAIRPDEELTPAGPHFDNAWVSRN
jgi:hypothetical protein